MPIWETSNRLLSERRAARIIRVAAHDTVIVRWNSEREDQLRLWGIRCPQGTPVGGGAGTKALHDLLGEWVIVRETGQAPDGSLIGEILRKDESVNAALVEQGQAWHDLHQYPSAWDLALCQWRAQRNRVGIWAAPVLSDRNSGRNL